MESGIKEVAGQAARPATADRWSVNKRGGPTLPQPQAWPRNGKAQDGSAAKGDRAPSPPQARNAAPWGAGQQPGRAGCLGAARERGDGQAAAGTARGLRRDARPGPDYLAAATPRTACGDEPSPAPLRLPPRLRPLPSVRTWSPRARARLPAAGGGGRGVESRRGGGRGGVTVGEGGKRMGNRPRALRDPNGGGEGPRSQINPTESSTTSRPDPVSRRPVIGLTPPAVQPMGGRLFPGAGGGPRRGDVTPAPGADCKARTGTAGGDCGPSAPCGVARVARRPSPLRQTPQAY